MAATFSTIFLGSTPRPFHPIVRNILTYLKETKKYKHLVVPCAGSLTIPQLAVSSGWKQSEIFASDVSLYTQALASWINGKPFKDLELEIDHPYWSEITDQTKTAGYADLFILMKVLQLRDEVAYERGYIEDLMTNTLTYHEQLTKEASNLRTTLAGFNYESRDLREHVAERCADPKCVLWLNPPAYTRGYQKMYDFRGAMPWCFIDVDEFDWNKEYDGLWTRHCDSEATMLWYRQNGITTQQKPYAIAGFERKPGKRDYILCTRPKEIPKRFRQIITKSEPALRPLKCHIFNDDDTLTRDSVIHFEIAKAENSLYYRSLWAHRLGETAAEMYTIWFIDGKVFSTCGFHLQELTILKSDMIKESFGFSAFTKKYTNLTRLLMMCLVSGEMKNQLGRMPMVVTNKLVKVRGLKTACLSKYRKVRLNNGILRITKREKMPNGMYKTMYEALFNKKSFADCVADYLTETEKKEEQ